MLEISPVLIAKARVATFDIESELIPPEGILFIRKIYCINIKINDGPVQRYTSLYHKSASGNLQTALAVLNSCDYIVGQNIFGFDIPVIENLVGKITSTPIDTLIITQLLYSKDTLMSIDYGIEEEMEVTQLSEYINQLIDTLPPKRKEVFLLSRKSHLSYKEISTQLNISEKTVEHHISKALKYLRENIQLILIFLAC